MREILFSILLVTSPIGIRHYKTKYPQVAHRWRRIKKRRLYLNSYRMRDSTAHYPLYDWRYRDEVKSRDEIEAISSLLLTSSLYLQWTVRFLSITVLNSLYAWDTLFYSIGYLIALYPKLQSRYPQVVHRKKCIIKRREKKTPAVNKWIRVLLTTLFMIEGIETKLKVETR